MVNRISGCSSSCPDRGRICSVEAQLAPRVIHPEAKPVRFKTSCSAPLAADPLMGVARSLGPIPGGGKKCPKGSPHLT